MQEWAMGWMSISNVYHSLRKGCNFNAFSKKINNLVSRRRLIDVNIKSRSVKSVYYYKLLNKYSYIITIYTIGIFLVFKTIYIGIFKWFPAGSLASCIFNEKHIFNYFQIVNHDKRRLGKIIENFKVNDNIKHTVHKK